MTRHNKEITFRVYLKEKEVEEMIKNNYEKIYRYDEDEYDTYDKYIQNGPILFNGSSDISSKGKEGEYIRIPTGSAWGGGVLGNGLYTTPNYDTAQIYSYGISGSLADGGIGCSKGGTIYGLNIENKNIKGIIFDEKFVYDKDRNYTQEYLKIKDEYYFIVNDKEFSEIMFLPKSKDLIKIVKKYINEYDICSKPFNFKIQLKGPDTNFKQVKHDCLINNTLCPTTCKYRKEKNEHEMPCFDDTITGGIYYKKYIKYKSKYLNLLNNLHK